MAAIQIAKQTLPVFPLVGIQGLSIIVAVVMWLFIDSSKNFVYLISVFIVLQFVWSLWSWRVTTETWFDPYVIFLIAAYLFNGGKAFLEVFHLNEHGIENITIRGGYLLFSFSIDTIARSLLLVFIGLGSMHMGALLAVAKTKKYYATENPTIAKSVKASALVGWFLIIISSIPMILTMIEKYQIVLKSGYFGLFQREPKTGFDNLHAVLSQFMIPGIFFLLVGSKGKRHLTVFCTLLMSIYVLLQAFTGTRLWWAMPLVAYVWLWHSRITPIPGTFLWTGAVVMLFIIFPVIAVVRNLPGTERLSLYVYLMGLFSIKNPAIDILQEMGNTLLTVAHTLELIPSVRSFDFGLSYLYAMFTVFPNFFWDIHPTIARGLFSHWLTATVAPAVYRAGGGYGFSFIAEAYANFGWIGVPIILGLVGFLFAKFVLWGRSSEPEKGAAVASFLAFFLIYARGESGLIMRPLVWDAFIPYIMVKILKRRLK